MFILFLESHSWLFSYKKYWRSPSERGRPLTRLPFQSIRTHRPTKRFRSQDWQIRWQKLLNQQVKGITTPKITNQCHVCGKNLQNLNLHLYEKHGISKSTKDTVRRDSHGYIIIVCPKCGEEKTRLRNHLKRKHKLPDLQIQCQGSTRWEINIFRISAWLGYFEQKEMPQIFATHI